jgi:poly(glycerol-phosphate) alpha-glucosyltransferase
MKVITTLTTIDPLKGGGVCEMVYNLNRTIKNSYNNIRVEICSLDYDTSNEIKNKWSIFDTHLHNAYDPFLYGFSPALKRCVVQSDSDILHNHGIWEYTSYVCLQWKKLKRKPYIVSPHGMLDSWALSNSQLKKKIMYSLIDKEYLANASCIHALNKEEAKSIQALKLDNPICIIPNGIDIPEDHIVTQPIWEESIRDKKVLLFLGRLHPKKGLENLLYAWSNVVKKNKEWVLVIAGWAQNDYDKKLKKIIEEHSLTGSVYFTGSVLGEDKVSVLQHSNAFILPSFSEGLPMSVLEAWSYRLPVIMTKECNLSDAFEYECAIKIGTSIHSIEETLITFFSMSEKDQRELGDRGYKYVKNKYSWDQVAKQMFDVYSWIIGDSPKPNCIV